MTVKIRDIKLLIYINVDTDWNVLLTSRIRLERHGEDFEKKKFQGQRVYTQTRTPNQVWYMKPSETM